VLSIVTVVLVLAIGAILLKKAGLWLGVQLTGVGSQSA
jgi:hypothetical protein